ncbi:MAG: ThiF family adenylyltransferase [candidate division WOR-3 bacterium]
MIEERLKRIFPLYFGKKIENLKNKKIFLIGLGALGSNILDLLVRAGVKNIVLMDRDYVEFSDLLTSPFYTRDDAQVSKPKVIAAFERIKSIDKDINAFIFFENFSPQFVKNFNFSGIDLLIDAVDNLETRFLINEISFKYKIPWIHGACVAERGEVSFFKPWEAACYRCLFNKIPERGRLETCETHGINPSVSKIVAGIESDIAIKYLTVNKSFVNKIIYIDYSEGYSLREFEIKKRKDCPLCIKGIFEFMDRKEEKIITFCSEKNVFIKLENFDFEKIKEKWKGLENFSENIYFIRINPKGLELKFFKEGKLFISSEEPLEEKKVKTIISRYIGN